MTVHKWLDVDDAMGDVGISEQDVQVALSLTQSLSHSNPNPILWLLLLVNSAHATSQRRASPSNNENKLVVSPTSPMFAEPNLSISGPELTLPLAELVPKRGDSFGKHVLRRRRGLERPKGCPCGVQCWCGIVKTAQEEVHRWAKSVLHRGLSLLILGVQISYSFRENDGGKATSGSSTSISMRCCWPVDARRWLFWLTGLKVI
ncbi:hypothetical protein GALMADRAFT_565706 [Galerina marginata CBS 339.88]|uniref:Uncharacterized protein n=1 Tax=Galerina marginata (strain CBS 339.88) TaxID=685588 RepID=A0A067SVF7_GALM3|nr:hypothetical protein GALMADRAFT_565706 [Galerina marginata CBS 339.88]